MTEETHESTQPRMTGQLANLASMVDHEFVELVWENGQLLRRRPPKRTQNSPSCIGYSSHSSNVKLENGDDTFTTTRARFGSLNSSLGDHPFPSHTKFPNHDKMDSYPKYTHTNPLQDNDHPALLPELYRTNFDVFLEHNRSYSNDKQHLTDSQIVPVHEHANWKPEFASKFVEEVPQLTTTRKSSLQQCEASVPFIRSRGVSSQTPVSMGGLPNSKLQEQDSGPDKKRETVNFSLFRPTAFVKASIERSGATWQKTCIGLSRAEELKSNHKRSAPGRSNPAELMLIEPGNGSKGVTGLHNQPNPMETKVKLIPPIAKPPDESLPDEDSETIGHKDAFTNKRSPDHVHVHVQTSSLEANTAKGKPETGKSIEPPYASYSVCSRGASNDPTYNLKRRCEDTEGSPYPSDNVEEEPQGVTKVVPARGRTGAKRYRTADVHNLSERRRSDKINKKMRALQELIPNCNKVDKASMLDEAIEYLKSLQFQVQMMSMGTGLCMPPMMLPTRLQQIHAPQEAHFSPMGVGMGMRMHMGVGCNPAQFLPLPISGAAAVPWITESRLQMLGYPSQALPMSLWRAPFVPLHGWPSIQPFLVPGVSGTTAPVEFLGSVPLSSSKDSKI